METRFNVVFTGQIQAGYTVEQVKQNIAALYKVPVIKLDGWFSGHNIPIKKNTDEVTANKYKQAIEKTGAICKIETIPLPKKNAAVTTVPVPQDNIPQQMICPKCGFEQPKAEICRRCKVIIKKYFEIEKKNEFPQKSTKQEIFPQKRESTTEEIIENSQLQEKSAIITPTQRNDVTTLKKFNKHQTIENLTNQLNSKKIARLSRDFFLLESLTPISKLPKKTKLLLVLSMMICIVIGYFAGREHLKYQVKSTVEDAFTKFGEGLEKAFDTEERKTPSSSKSSSIPSPITIRLQDKSYDQGDSTTYESDDRITFEFHFTNRLKKDLRAFTGIVIFRDIFDRVILNVGLTYEEPLASNETGLWVGSIDFNPFLDSHKKLKITEMKDISVDFVVEKVIYQDGTKENFSE